MQKHFWNKNNLHATYNVRDNYCNSMLNERCGKWSDKGELSLFQESGYGKCLRRHPPEFIGL